MITITGNRLSERLYGTNLTRDALNCSNVDADWWADFIASLGMNAVRLVPGDAGITNWDNFWYLLNAMKERGIRWAVPLQVTHQPGDFTNQSRIDEKLAWCDQLFGTTNPYTGVTIGADENLVFIEISNEASIWSDRKPGNWAGLTDQTKRETVESIMALESEYYALFSGRIKQHSNALLIGSQANYQFQSNTLDLCDRHMYTNRPTGPSNGPWTFANSLILEDAALWPISGNYDRDPSKPFGCSEVNDGGPGWYYHANLLAYIATACVQDWSWFFHYHMGNGLTPVTDHIPGTLRDDAHLGKHEILRLGAELFLGEKIAAAPDRVGYVPADYVAEIVATGYIDPFNLRKAQGGIDYWLPLKNSQNVVAALNSAIELSYDGGFASAYHDCTYSVPRTIGRCENTGMVWDDPTDDPDTPPTHYSGWGGAPVILDSE